MTGEREALAREVEGLMDSLDEHVTHEDIYDALKALWNEIREGQYHPEAVTVTTVQDGPSVESQASAFDTEYTNTIDWLVNDLDITQDVAEMSLRWAKEYRPSCTPAIAPDAEAVEPTDAQVEAAARAIWEVPTMWSEKPAWDDAPDDEMRALTVRRAEAALRAALTPEA